MFDRKPDEHMHTHIQRKKIKNKKYLLLHLLLGLSTNWQSVQIQNQYFKLLFIFSNRKSKLKGDEFK